MKIYKCTETEWFAAKTAREAKRYAKEFIDEAMLCDDEEYLLEKPELLTDEQLDKLKFTEDCGTTYKKTFRQKLNEMIEAGEKFPCIFATSEF
jgi:hypothetical protein